jgi:hypothetical protein
MSFVQGFLQGVVYTLTLNSPPLFRYPYRNTMEAFRGDWKQIGGDIESATQSFRGISEGEADE